MPPRHNERCSQPRIFNCHHRSRQRRRVCLHLRYPVNNFIPGIQLMAHMRIHLIVGLREQSATINVQPRQNECDRVKTSCAGRQHHYTHMQPKSRWGTTWSLRAQHTCSILPVCSSKTTWRLCHDERATEDCGLNGIAVCWVSSES